MIDLPDSPLGFDALPEPLRARIETELVPGERLLWASVAGPKPDAALLNPLKPLVIGLLVLAASMALFVLSYRWNRPLPSGEPGGPFVLGCITAVVAGIAFLIAAGAWKARKKNRRPDSRALYMLSDRRIIVWEAEDAAGGVEVISIDPPTVRSVHRLEYPNGLGEVRISFTGEDPEAGILLPRHLLGLTDVRRVEALVRAVMIAPARSVPFVCSPEPQQSFDPDTSEEPF